MEISTNHPHIQAILQDFLDLNLLNSGTWLAGGAVRDAVVGGVPSDYDMFFQTMEEAQRVEEKLRALNAEVIFVCPNGKLTTFKYEYGKSGPLKIQVIKEKTYSNMESLIATFDFTACKFATDGKTVIMNLSSFRDARNKMIRFEHDVSGNPIIEYPTATLKRISKYSKKGYKLTSEAAIDLIDYIYIAGATGTPIDDRLYID